MHKYVPKTIGGYFGLELPMGNVWHTGAVPLNSGRNALQYLLRARSPVKIYIPQFTCAAIAETIAGLGIEFEHYGIDEAMEPIFDYAKVAENEAFLYTNYFGLKNQYIQGLIDRGCHLIIDNAQSFFSPRIEAFDTFYSPRKFFGVPDGGYAFGGHPIELEQDHSSERTEHLMIRHDDSARAGYVTFQANEGLLATIPMKAMSALSDRILRSIDYAGVSLRRKINFQKLHSVLGSSNNLPIDNDRESVALTYPYLSKNSKLKSRLHAQNIFTASYWPDVEQSVNYSSLERLYSTQIVHLPIDQRYDEVDMQRILEVVLS